MDSGTPSSGPLSGVRVADFSVHAAGPFAGLMLAELGAQVIKIESAARLDITRRPHTMYGKPVSSFEQVNANKLSVCLNLKEPRAVELALELVRLSDLVLENFRPGVMERLGLGYERLRQLKPDIVVVFPVLERADGAGAALCWLRSNVFRPRRSGPPNRLPRRTSRGATSCNGPHRRHGGGLLRGCCIVCQIPPPRLSYRGESFRPAR